MKRRKSLWPLARAVVVFGTLGIILTGITFAALQSPAATLANNTINVGSADLRIGLDGTTFSTSVNTGLTFNGVVPGGANAPVDGLSVYLKNIGSVGLALKAGIGPAAPTNLSGVDLSKTFLHITRVDSGFDQSFSLKSLIDGYANGVVIGDTINNGNTIAQYKLRVSMAADAYNGSGANVTISGINLVFTGTGQ